MGNSKCVDRELDESFYKQLIQADERPRSVEYLNEITKERKEHAVSVHRLMPLCTRHNPDEGEILFVYNYNGYPVCVTVEDYIYHFELEMDISRIHYLLREELCNLYGYARELDKIKVAKGEMSFEDYIDIHGERMSYSAWSMYTCINGNVLSIGDGID